MRRVQDSLPRHFQAGLSYNETGCMLKISKNVDGKHVSMTRSAGINYGAAQALDDDALEARLDRPAAAINSPPAGQSSTKSSSAPTSP